MATGTVLANTNITPPNNPIRKRIISWTSDASGNASDTFDMNGVIVGVETVPGSGGSAPTSYGVTCLNASGVDVFSSLGAARSATAAEAFCPAQSISDGTNTGIAPRPVEGVHTFNVSGAGNTKSGTITIYLR